NFERGAQRPAGSYTATEHHAIAVLLPHGTHHLRHEDAHGGRLERRGEISATRFQFPALLELSHARQHGSLETAERERVIVVVAGCLCRCEHRPGKCESARIAVRRNALDRRAAWILQAENPGDFVERLAHRIVTRLSEQLVAAP